MVSIDYAKLDEVSVALKKLYEMLQYNLEESKLGYNSIYITPLEALKCPEIGGFEDDMNKLQARGNEALDDIQKLITGIHNVINKFQETESKLERDVNAATVSSSTLLGAGVLSTSALMMLGMESGVQAFGSKDDASFSDKAVASQGTSGIVASDRKDVTGIAVGAIGINMKTQQSKGVNVAKTSSKTSSEDNKILDAVLQWGENLGDHPVDTGMAVLGVGLGAIGVVGSGALEYFSIGTASPATVPVAAFSLNSIISSGSQLVDIAGGNYKNQRNLNLLKSGSETVVGGLGKIVDIGVNGLTGNKTSLAEAGKIAGGYVYEGGAFVFGAIGVGKGVKLIADTSSKTVLISSTFNKIIPTMSHLVKNVPKSQKVGKAVSITYTVANWIKKGISIHNGVESTKSIKPTLRTIVP